MNYIYNCLLDENSFNIQLNNFSNLENTNKLFEGMYVYSEATKSCTNIKSIPTDRIVSLNKKPFKSGNFNITFSDLVPYKYLELCEALHDVCTIVNNNGQFVQIVFRNESELKRDDYNAIEARKRNNSINIKAFPIEFSPTVDQIERAGFMEKMDVVIWLARCDLIKLGINFNDFDELRTTVKINNETFKLRNKNRVSQMGNDYLYYTLGLMKK